MGKGTNRILPKILHDVSFKGSTSSVIFHFPCALLNHTYNYFSKMQGVIFLKNSCSSNPNVPVQTPRICLSHPLWVLAGKFPALFGHRLLIPWVQTQKCIGEAILAIPSHDETLVSSMLEVCPQHGFMECVSRSGWVSWTGDTMYTLKGALDILVRTVAK